MATLAHGQKYDELRSVIGGFMAEFATLESLYLGSVIRALTHDVELVEFMEELMPLEQRLTLVKRLAKARAVAEPVASQLTEATNRLKRLAEFRNEVAHGAAVVSVASAIPGEAIAGEAVAGSGGLFAGVRRPRSKRTNPSHPPATAEELAEVLQSWHHSVPEIEARTQEVLDLQATLLEIAGTLWKR